MPLKTGGRKAGGAFSELVTFGDFVTSAEVRGEPSCISRIATGTARIQPTHFHLLRPKIKTHRLPRNAPRMSGLCRTSSKTKTLLFSRQRGSLIPEAACFFQEIVIPAGVRSHRAIVNMEHLGGEFTNKVHIVGDEHQRTFVML